ncbi:MAG: hypothetical protein KGO96_13920 [Elusimicrobia bacterium]|nr:hypothetical protein [Elusimicrobiota bacterium]MDE2426991.1 hypothetical protein [Elusimicrobiota bacterium]
MGFNYPPASGGTQTGPYAATGTYAGTGAANNVNVQTICGISWAPRCIEVVATATYNRVGFLTSAGGTNQLQGLNTTTAFNEADTFNGTTLTLTVSSLMNVSGVTYAVYAW